MSFSGGSFVPCPLRPKSNPSPSKIRPLHNVFLRLQKYREAIA